MKKIKLTPDKLRELIKEVYAEMDMGQVRTEDELFAGPWYEQVWDALVEFADDPMIDRADFIENEVRVYYADGHYDVIMTIDDPAADEEAEAAVEDWNATSY